MEKAVVKKEKKLKVKGFTLVELLIAVVLAGIVLMAIVGLYLASDKAFKKNKPVSDVLEEMRSAISILEFVFSRWGVGVPCSNNTCNITSFLTPCNGYPPSDPMCITCNKGSLETGCSDVEFYANFYGMGFVTGINGSIAKVISCRLRSKKSQNYYYIWNSNGVLLDASGVPITYQLSNLNPDNKECINLDSSPNAEVNVQVKDINNTTSYSLQPGDVIIRVPHKVRLYIKNKSLRMETWDMYDPFNPQYEGSKEIAKVTSFLVYKSGRGVKIKIKFVSQSDSSKVFEIEKYFAR
jgi:prepilin-type N-terminal cleavage/methylation domain-containing protein